jgi:hypothetical protein
MFKLKNWQLTKKPNLVSVANWHISPIAIGVSRLQLAQSSIFSLPSRAETKAAYQMKSPQ